MRKNPSVITISEISEPSRNDDEQDDSFLSDYYGIKKSHAIVNHDYPRTCPTEQDAFKYASISEVQEEFENMVDYEEALIQDSVDK